MVARLFAAIVVFSHMTGVALAECSASDIRRLIQQGLTDTEIDARCNRQQAELPGWLEGTWNVTEIMEQSSVPGFGYPPTLAVWRITVGPGMNLSIAEVRDADLAGTGLDRAVEIPVRDVQFSGRQLRFQTRTKLAGSIVTTKYILNLGSETDQIEGRYSQGDTGALGMPQLSTKSSGAVTMIKR